MVCACSTDVPLPGKLFHFGSPLPAVGLDSILKILPYVAGKTCRSMPRAYCQRNPGM